jgi:hypothetical protein
MSSFATAPSREPRNGQEELDLLVNPEDEPLPLNVQHAGTVATGHPQALEEINRVERLLSHLESRSLALVPYGYGTLREVSTRKSGTGVLAGVLVAIWLSSLVLAVAYIRYVNRSPEGPERAGSTAPLIIPPESDAQEQKVATSVDHLAKALASSSKRMDELQAAMERSNRDLQRIAVKVVGDQSKPVADSSGAEASDNTLSSSAAEANLPKNWHRVLDLKPTESAVAHKAADGTVDYWLVPRGAGQPSSKVLSIGTGPEGVVVHDLDDGKDYTVTPSGEWRNGALAPPSN